MSLMPSVKQERINKNKNVNTHWTWGSQDYPSIKTAQGSQGNYAIYQKIRQIQLLFGNIT